MPKSKKIIVTTVSSEMLVVRVQKDVRLNAAVRGTCPLCGSVSTMVSIDAEEANGSCHKPGAEAVRGLDGVELRKGNSAK